MKSRVSFCRLLVGLIAVLLFTGQADAQKQKRSLSTLAERVAERVLPELKGLSLFPSDPDRKPYVASRTLLYGKAHFQTFLYDSRQRSVKVGTIVVLKPQGKRGPNRRYVPSGKTWDLKQTPAYLSILLHWGKLHKLTLRRQPEREITINRRYLKPHPRRGRVNAREPVRSVNLQVVKEKNYAGMPGQMRIETHKGRWIKPVSERHWDIGAGPSTTQYHEVISIDQAKKIEAILWVEVEGIKDPFRATVVATSSSYLLPAIDEGKVDNLMSIIAGAIFAELGRPAPKKQESQQVAEKQEESKSKPKPEEKEETDKTDSTASSDESERPPKAEESAEERIARMDAVLKGAEDALTGSLLLIFQHTQLMLALRAQIEELKQAIRSPGDPDDPHPENTKRLKDKMRAKVRKLVRHLKTLSRQRETLVRDAMARMAHIVRKVEGIYNAYGFGELDSNAYSRVLAARERRTYFMGQVLLAKNDAKGALRLARTLQGESTTRTGGFRIEAMALFLQGKLVESLEALRTARRMGRKGKDGEGQADAQGPLTFWELAFQERSLDVLERHLELRVLRALTRQALVEKDYRHEAFDRWAASHSIDDLNADPWNAYWFVKGAVWRGWYDTVSGALASLPMVGESSAEARARQVGDEVDDLALTHVGLNLVYGLRNKGMRLDEIGKLNTERLREAVKRFWGRELSEQEARQKLQVLRHAFSLPDLKRLASGEVLTEQDVLSGPLLQQIRADSLWEKGLELGAGAGNLFNGELLILMGLPHAKLAGLRSTRLLRGASKAKELAFVPTVSEYFAASRPVTWAMTRLSQSRWTKPFLQAAAAVERFGQCPGCGPGILGKGRKLAQAASVFVGEFAVYMGAVHTAGEYLGDEGRLLTDIFLGVGLGHVSFWTQTFKRVNMGRPQLERVAGRMRTMATAMERNVGGLSSLAKRTRQVLKEAGEGALNESSVRKLQALRRELSKLMDAPPELTSRLRYALDQAESGYGCAALQTLKDQDAAAAVWLRRSEESLRAAGQMEQIASHLPKPAESRLRRIGPEDLQGKVIVDNVVGGGGRAARQAGGGELVPVGRGELVPVRPGRGGLSGEARGGTVVLENVPGPGGPGGLVMGRGAGRAGTAAQGGLWRPRPRLPSGSGGQGGAGGGGGGDGGAGTDTTGTVIIGTRPQDPVFFSSDRHKSALTHRADRLMADGRPGEAKVEYTRILQSDGLKPEAVRTIQRKRQMAREMMQRRKALNKLRRRAAERGLSRTGPAEDIGDNLRQTLQQKAPDAKYLGPAYDSASRPRPIYEKAAAERAAGERPLAWAKRVEDQTHGHPGGVAETLGSKLRRAAGRPGQVTEIVDLKLPPTASQLQQLELHDLGPLDRDLSRTVNEIKRRIAAGKPPTPEEIKAGIEAGLPEELARLPEPRQPYAVTRDYGAHETLLTRLENLAANGQRDRILPELLVRKEGIVEDMVDSMISGDGDRHFANFALFNDGSSMMPMDNWLGDIFEEHKWYRNYDKYNEYARGVTDDGAQIAKGLQEQGKEFHGLFRHPDLPGRPDLNDPAALREHALKTMQMHFEHIIRQQLRQLNNLDPTAVEYYLSVFRSKDFRQYVESRQRALRGGRLEQIVEEAFRGRSPREIEYAKKLLKTRLEILPEFFGDVEKRIDRAVEILKREGGGRLSFVLPDREGLDLRFGRPTLRRASPLYAEWKMAA
ncbi:MAG: hypothetical protein ACE5JS_09940 [Nitrospinota bacterium]